MLLSLTSCRPGAKHQAQRPLDQRPESLAPAARGDVDTSVIVIAGPTLVAAVPYTTGYLDSNVTDESDLATVLDDFSFYLGVTDSAIAARGIHRLMRIGPVVRWVRNGQRDSLVLGPDSGVAYLFWGEAPTGPKVHRGVMTDVDLMEFVGGTAGQQRP